MRKREKIEQARYNLLKATRGRVRAKHSEAADNELNELLPTIEDYFNTRIQLGEWPDKEEVLARFKVDG